MTAARYRLLHRLSHFEGEPVARRLPSRRRAHRRNGIGNPVTAPTARTERPFRGPVRFADQSCGNAPTRKKVGQRGKVTACPASQVQKGR
ncbi:hypothetical protein AKJ09_02197 [Labilithrix luteola]|uniref:Uncharacterized protein n=1 Tax=Labilithrix luteola TaxID=1391654 RepID=A0A0K1PPT1_9BACT|nr:hypothetical protein AKJ09_02197 [Labilithrix luteola]